MVAIFAISSSFFLALSYVFTRVGLRHSNPLSGVLITMVSSLAISLIISLFAIPLKLFFNKGVLFFIAVGVLGPFLARFFFFIGIQRVGASIAAPISEIKALFSAITAVLILGESFTFSIALGMILITAGAAIIGSEESGGQIEKKWSRKDLIFPFLAGAGWGVSHIFRKMGLNIIPEPIVGVTVQNAAALAFFPLLTLNQRHQQRVVWSDKRAWFIFSLAGISTFIAHLCLFWALDLGQVVVVSPLSSLTPFFVLLLVGIFLRKLERVTCKIILGAIFIAGGTVLLTLMPLG